MQTNIQFVAQPEWRAMSLHFEDTYIIKNKPIMVSDNGKQTRWNLPLIENAEVATATN